MQDSPTRNWKREPLVWLLIAIPASAVVMGVVMISLAVNSYSGLVVDDYYKHGKQINRVLARDRLAWELGLAARMQIDAGGAIRIRFDPGAAAIPGDAIELALVHATMPGRDQSIRLQRSEPGVLDGRVGLTGEGRWNLYLQTDDWRLTGSLRYPAQASARLVPNYAPR